jgi:hypothetical protein
MQIEAQLDTATMKRLKNQGRMLLRIYRRELEMDPASAATERSRSNVMALQDSIRLVYGQAVALEVANSLGSTTEIALSVALPE